MGSKNITTKAEAAEAVKKQFTPEQLNNGKITKEAILELLEDDPKVGIIYPAQSSGPFITLTR